MMEHLQTAVDYRALADFRYEIRRFLNFSEQAARVARIQPHQHQALLAIKGLPSGRRATVGLIAERLQIQHHSAVELSLRLEAKGLIRRRPGLSDRREVVLSLSSRGEQVLRELSLSHRAELRSAGPTLLRALVEIIRVGTHPKKVRMKTSRVSRKKKG